jgi:ornithine--oxo-acid transaminase
MTNINKISDIYPASATSAADVIARESRYGARNYLPLPVVLTRGSGVWLWDVNGRRYLDMMGAYSAASHGHCHPRLVQALTTQAQRLDVVSRAYHTDVLGPFLERLCHVSGMDMALPMNTGAEAVETAIKAARRWGYRVKKVPADRAEIIVAAGNFHGRTTAVIGFSSEPDYRADFGPFAPGFVHVPFGDSAAVERAITPNTAAVFIEPIQGEAGIRVPPKEWLADLRRICDRHNVLLIVDEVQSGLGRTGRMFAFEHAGIRPDGVVVGKALGGGLLPVSAFLARAEVMNLFEPGSHGSTFGGNPLAAAVGLEALKVLEEEKLVERSAELGAHLMARLKAVDSALITDVRGQGLWVGVEIDPARATAREVCERLADVGILTKETHDTVVRFAPPFVITREEIDWAVSVFTRVLHDITANNRRAAS